MRRALKIVGIQGIPLLFLLVWPLSSESRLESLILIGLVVAVAFAAVAWSIRTRQAVAVPVGWAVLVTTVAVLQVTECFVVYVNLDLLYVLFAFSLIGWTVLTLGIGQSLISVGPAVSLEGRPVNGLGRLGYRLVIPAFLSMPLFWLILSQFRRASYNGDNPNEFNFLIMTAQHYVFWAALVLFPFAAGVTIHSLIVPAPLRRMG